MFVRKLSILDNYFIFSSSKVFHFDKLSVANLYKTIHSTKIIWAKKILDKLLIFCTFMLGILVAKGIDVYFILKKYFFEGSILKYKKIII